MITSLLFSLKHCISSQISDYLVYIYNNEACIGFYIALTDYLSIAVENGTGNQHKVYLRYIIHSIFFRLVC